MRIPLSKIDTEQSVKIRTINAETVERYAEHIEAKGPPLPPVVVFGPDSRGMYFLSEGWHRYEAHRRAKRDGIMATVREGDWKAALEHALGSNATHGLPRSSKDKRRVVELAITHWPDWSHQMISDKCALSKRFVEYVRKELQPSHGATPDESRQVKGKDGKTYTIPPVPTRPPAQKPATTPPATPPEKPKGPPLPVDPAGRTILPHLLTLWAGRDTLKRLAASIADVRREIEQAFDDRDPLFCGQDQGVAPVNRQGIVAALQRAEGELKAAIPWGVCGMCNGTGCRACSGNGLVTEVQRNRMAPEYR